MLHLRYPRHAPEKHISLSGSDHWDSKLSTNIHCEKSNRSVFLNSPTICKKKMKKNYIPDIFWAFRSKLQIILAATCIAPFLPDTNNCSFICIVLSCRLSFYFLLRLQIKKGFFSYHILTNILSINYNCFVTKKSPNNIPFTKLSLNVH